MAPTVVLITGASRGIGNGLLKLYLSKPNHTIIAANRNPGDPNSTALADLPRAEGTTLLVVKLDLDSPTSPVDAANELAARGIGHVDILISNAGIALVWPRVSEVKVEDIEKHVQTNYYGFVRLIQAFLPLLKKSSDPRNFIPYANAAYAPSKLVQHWYTKALSVEEPWLTAYPIDPGWVQSELGNRGAHAFGIEKAAISVEESAGGLVRVIDASTKETHSGKLWKHDGSQEPW